MKAVLFLFGTFFMLGGCVSNQPTSKPVRDSTPEPVVVIEAQPEPLKEVVTEEIAEPYKKLIFNTKLSISPTQPNWVLFENGSYILFPKGTSKNDMRKSALGLLQRFNNDQLKITKSPLVKGWIAGSTKGVYNYVSLDQAGDRMISNQNLAVIAQNNINRDKEQPLIVHINEDD